MKIKSTLVRLQNALGWNNLADQIVLSEGLELERKMGDRPGAETMNVLIGYNGSANSQVALDLALWIAHQTRMASQTKVLVHVVYIVDRRKPPSYTYPTVVESERTALRTALRQASGLPIFSLNRRVTDPTIPNKPVEACLTVCQVQPKPSPATQNLLDQADCILWQARCLAEEWRGSLEAHLRFGPYPDELLTIAREVKADLIVVGCSSPEHDLVRQLAPQAPCPIWGIPHQLEEF